MLKGHSKVELFDAKSGRRVHVQEKDNMVTNALSTLYSARPDFYVYNTYPICPNTLGGILLFPNALTEDVNNIYAPSTNFPVGYSSNDVNTTADALRGSMNQTESGVIDNGYKFVFDFATSQANGTISSLSLTHSMAGQTYYGSEASASLALINLGSYKKSNASYNDMWIMNNTIEIDSVNNYAYQLVLNARNSITIRKLKFPLTKVGLNTLKYYYMNAEETIITTLNMPSSGRRAFCDGFNGYWYFFRYTPNSTGNASVYWVKIKKSDYTFTEGTWTLTDAQLEGSVSFDMYHPGGTSPIYIAPSCAIANGCLYIAKYHISNGDSYGLYKIDLNNSANISLVAPNGNFGNMSDSSSSLKSLNGFVFGTYGYIDGNDNYHAFKSSVNTFVDSRLCASGMTAFYCSNGTNYIYIIAPYLATINNITPVTKTADKTMKITYTVTES